jgi:hypothetical protein
MTYTRMFCKTSKKGETNPCILSKKFFEKKEKTQGKIIG